MTTFKSFIRIAALVLRSIHWAAVARRCWITVQLITTALVLLAEIAWEHRAQIRQALVTAIAATYLAGQWTRQQAERTLRAGACFYRACARGCCLYARDRWRAENDLDALLARSTPSRILDGRIRLEAAASKHFRR